MTTPFDTKDLLEKLKTNGIHLLEEDVKFLTECCMDWLSESCMIHSSSIVKAAGTLLVGLKPIVINLEDKIDGQEG